MWSDASGTKGRRAFYSTGEDFESTRDYLYIGPTVVPQLGPATAFSIALPYFITRTAEYIHTKEIPAVEQALLHQ